MMTDLPWCGNISAKPKGCRAFGSKDHGKPYFEIATWSKFKTWKGANWNFAD